MKASQRKRLKTLRKHRNRHKRMSRRREKKATVPTTTAIVTVEKPAIMDTSVRSMVSMVRKVQETVEDLERVRRFMSTCLNIDMQKWERTHPFPANGTEEEKNDWDEERRSLQVDWGTIPGIEKPFLMQPGAEKFLFWLELRPKYFNRETEQGEGHLEIVSHVVFYHKRTKEEVFEGPDCSCTTMEDNFRFIWAERRDPCTCANKYDCFKAGGLCEGGKYKERQKDVNMGKSRKVSRYARGRFVGKEWAWFERVEIPNIHSKRNNVRQIGQKRALVKGVRNMGAISEIFTQPPDEWDIPEEREDTPETDMDYTESGRRIYVDGKSPSGKHTDPKTQDHSVRRQALSDQQIAALKAEGGWCEKHQCDIALCPSDEHTREENDAACKIIEKRKSSAKAGAQGAAASRQPQVNTAPPANSRPEPTGGAPTYAGSIFVDFSLDAATPVVRGDLSNLTEDMEKYCGAAFHDGWWRIPIKCVETVAAIAKQLNYKFEIIQQSSSAASAEESRSTPRGSAPAAPPATKKRGPRKGTPGEHTIQGVIENAIPHSKGRSPRIDFLVKTDKGTFWMSCFNKTWFAMLAKEKYPCPVTLLVRTTINEAKGETYRNILRAIKIREDEYDENAKKVIQQKTREAGGPTLFG